jgi:hypothetical protein
MQGRNKRMPKTKEINEQDARAALGIKDDEWIVTLTNEELDALKIILNGKKSALTRAINKILEI